MTKRTVFFATNRAYDPRRNTFGSRPDLPEHRLWSGFAAVATSRRPERAGTADSPSVALPDDSDKGLRQTLADWVGAAEAGEIPLLFVHGFDFDFAEAIVRAGDIAEWLSQERGAPRFAPLCFTWPSDGIGSLSAYHADRTDAERAAPALAHLLAEIARLEAAAAQRSVLLAHSMGVSRHAAVCSVRRHSFTRCRAACSATPSSWRATRRSTCSRSEPGRRLPKAASARWLRWPITSRSACIATTAQYG